MKFRINKTEVTVSYTLVCLAAVCAILGLFGGLAVCIFAAAVHECGHLAAMKHFGTVPGKIKISLFEISISDKNRLTGSPAADAVIIFSGPLANFVCFIPLYLLYLLCGLDCLSTALANLFTGLFNMLPALSLDGGQLMYIFLLKRFGERAARLAVNAATVLCVIPLGAAGFAAAIAPSHNFSLAAVCVYLVAALIFKRDAF